MQESANFEWEGTEVEEEHGEGRRGEGVARRVQQMGGGRARGRYGAGPFADHAAGAGEDEGWQRGKFTGRGVRVRLAIAAAGEDGAGRPRGGNGHFGRDDPRGAESEHGAREFAVCDGRGE